MRVPADALAVLVAGGAFVAAMVVWSRLSRGRTRLRRVLTGAVGHGSRETRSTLARAVAAARSAAPHRWTGAPPPRSANGAVVVATLGIAGLGGPVAGLLALVYGCVTLRRWRRRAAQQRIRATRRRQLDELRAAASELRAGLPAATALGGAALGGAALGGAALGGAAGGGAALGARVRAVVSLADRTGAPLADLVERIEADERARDRGLAAAQAQAAGARATTWLLAGLPAAGLGLGFAIGADPLQVLLRTPVGAACAAGAVTLQLAGLAWSDRLVRIDGLDQ